MPGLAAAISEFQMSALRETAPRRPRWRLSNPANPGDRLVFKALSCFRVSIIRGRYVHHHEANGIDHFERRMQERGLDLAAVLHAVAVGRIAVFAPRGREWVGGGFVTNNGVMVYCQAYVPPGSGDFSAVVPSICSAWHVDPITPCRPLTVPVSELAHL